MEKTPQNLYACVNQWSCRLFVGPIHHNSLLSIDLSKPATELRLPGATEPLYHESFLHII